MTRHDRRHRWWHFVATLAWACLALACTGAHASSLAPRVVQEVRAEAVETRNDERMPGATDCRPCALCFVAPAPERHTFAGDSKAATEWPPPIAAAPQAPAMRAAWRRTCREHVPIRIAFCRWLD